MEHGDVRLTLVEAEEGVLEALAAQRSRLAQAWEKHHRLTARLEHDLLLLDDAIEARDAVFHEFLARFDDFSYHAQPAAVVEGGDPLAGPDDDRVIDPELLLAMDRALSGAVVELTEARNRLFHRRHMMRATEHINRHNGLFARLQDRRARVRRELADAHAARTDLDDLRAEAQAVLDTAAARAGAAENRLPPTLRRWTGDVPEPGDQPGGAHLYLGRLRPAPDPRLFDHAGFGTERTVPYVLPPGAHLHFAHTGAQRKEVHGLVRSMLLRALLAGPPGDARITVFDPVGAGRSVGHLFDLARHDPALVGGQIWSATPDLRQRLAEHRAHVDMVARKYLTTAYPTLDEVNADAGEAVEAYRYLVVFDFPSGFTEETTRELLRILEGGARSGVRVLLCTNIDLEIPYGVDVQSVAALAPPIGLARTLRREIGGYAVEQVLELDSDRLLPERLVRRILDRVGEAATSRGTSVIPFDAVFTLFRSAATRGLVPGLPSVAATVDPADPSTWWTVPATHGLTTPLGRGIREAVALTLDSGSRGGALLAGRAGAGRSTLLHVCLAGLTTLYGPDQLSLYLLDFTAGTEFLVYEDLPHARCVAVRADREFALDVLRTLADRLDGARTPAGRADGARTPAGRIDGAPTPAGRVDGARTLLVVDGIAELTGRGDRIGSAATALLRVLIEEGPARGVHVLLGDRSPVGGPVGGLSPGEVRPPVRIVLPLAEADARGALGEGNDAARYLTRPGEGIMNPGGGAEANERFRGACLTADELRSLVTRMREKAGPDFRRPVVFRGDAPAPFDVAAVPAGSPVRIPVGVPMALSGSAELELSREPGANVLVVAPDATALAQLSLAVAAFGGAAIDVVDFTTVDEGVAEALAPFDVRLHRRRALAGVLSAARDRPGLLVLYGVHRARDLDGDAEEIAALEQIVRDGPPNGLHTWIWCATADALSRVLPGPVARDLGWRIVGPQNPADSLRLLGTEDATDLHGHQIVLANDDRGYARRLTGYGVARRGSS